MNKIIDNIKIKWSIYKNSFPQLHGQKDDALNTKCFCTIITFEIIFLVILCITNTISNIIHNDLSTYLQTCLIFILNSIIVGLLSKKGKVILGPIIVFLFTILCLVKIISNVTTIISSISPYFLIVFILYSFIITILSAIITYFICKQHR